MSEPNDATAYDKDIVAWAEAQAEAMRVWAPRVEIVAGETNLPRLDWQNIIAEIEELAKSHRRELASRISTILQHMIKLAASPATAPRPGWRTTIREQRAEIERLLDDAPSLRREVAAIIEHELPIARDMAIAVLADYGETPRVDVGGLVYGEDQVLGGWWPA